jgi:hypothetical protein
MAATANGICPGLSSGFFHVTKIVQGLPGTAPMGVSVLEFVGALVGKTGAAKVDFE